MGGLIHHKVLNFFIQHTRRILPLKPLFVRSWGKSWQGPIWGLSLNFVECKPFSESNSSDVLALCEKNLDDLIDSGNFSMFLYFSISNDLTQMLNFPTWIPHCDSHSPALFNFFLSFDASICSTMAFPHCITYGYFPAGWDGLCDHLSVVPWKDIFRIYANKTRVHHFPETGYSGFLWFVNNVINKGKSAIPPGDAFCIWLVKNFWLSKIIWLATNC